VNIELHGFINTAEVSMLFILTRVAMEELAPSGSRGKVRAKYSCQPDQAVGRSPH